MRTVLLFLKKDLTDPMGSVITTMLLAALITLSLIMGMAMERRYLLNIPDSVRAVDAEDDCAFGTRDVRRYNGQLYCIGENQ